MNRAFAILGAALLAAAPATAQEQVALSGDRVAIYNLAGEVRVEASSGPSVTVDVTRGGRDAHELRVERTQIAGWQQMVIRYPANRIVYRSLGYSRSEFSVREDGTFGHRNLDPALGVERINKNINGDGGERIRIANSGDGLEAFADLKITVPAGHTVAIHLGVGKVFATNINGDLQIDSRSGSVNANGLSGFARIDTGSGSITLRDSEGDFGLHTGSGSIGVAGVARGVLVAETGSGDVELHDLDVNELAVRTGSGSVNLAGVKAPAARITTGSGGIRARRLSARNFDLNTGSGSVRVELTSDVQAGRIDTGSGGVDVAIAPDAGTEFTIDTGSGGIDMDMPGVVVTESRRSYLRGRIGDGNGTLRVSTGSGGVSFRSL